ncbi:MAG: hypothetical protein LAN71_06850 [Acidobacteriia bacterium]|nr:hypothetical protein [Terriglobia bacterium]
MKTKPLAPDNSRDHAKNRPAAAQPSRCLFPFSDGRQCSMLRHDSHPSLCLFHARQEQQLLDSPAIAAELAGLSGPAPDSSRGQFLTSTDISRVLGKLFQLLAQDRISRPKAATLAYITQLLLHNQHSVQHEFQQTLGYNAWENARHHSLTSQSACPLPPIPINP